MSAWPAPGTVLCRLDEVSVPGSKGVDLDPRRRIFVVRDAAGVYAFLNSCPHTGAPLDWVPDQFLSLDEKFILCAMHGALFRVRDGYCLGGPCLGASLTPVAVTVTDGAVVTAPAQRCGDVS